MKKFVRGICLLISIIGAINWGIWGIFQMDLIALLSKGNSTLLGRALYILVGICGILSLLSLSGKCCGKKQCCSDKKNM